MLYLSKSKKKESFLILEVREIVNIIEIKELLNVDSVLENLDSLK